MHSSLKRRTFGVLSKDAPLILLAFLGGNVSGRSIKSECLIRTLGFGPCADPGENFKDIGKHLTLRGGLWARCEVHGIFLNSHHGGRWEIEGLN